MITEKTWTDFQKTGLLLVINQVLHLFGWAIVMRYKDGQIVECYPARVKFRGFDNESVIEAYKNVTNHVAENIEELKEEANS